MDTPRKSMVRVILFGVFVTVIVGAVLYSLTRAYVINQAEKNIQNLLLSHRGIHQYIQRTMHPAYYKFREEGEIPLNFYSPEILSSSFIVRTQHQYYNEARVDAGLPEVYYKMAADNPRNPVNKADAMEEELIRYFNKHRDKKSYRDIIEIGGTRYLYYAMPFLTTEERCLTCHGEREDAPPGLQARYPGEGGFHDVVGNIRAIESIRAPLEKEYYTVYAIVGALLSGFLVILLLIFFNNRLQSLVKRRTEELEQEVAVRLKAEEEIRQLNRDLEARVEERTVQLAAANKELDSFAYSVSHDLRAPLRGIDGFSLALVEDYGEKLDETAKDYLTRIRGGCSKMGQLIDDLLTMSRLTRGELKKEKFNFSKAAQETIDDLSKLDPDRTVSVHIEEGLQTYGDPTLIQAVLQNLIGNAWKFTAKTAAARIDIGADQSGPVPVYFIKDNGAGFNMEYAGKLFGAFQRLHKADEFEGTGIGLATVQRIIHRHGGRIWAEGKEGEGAIFYFTLEMEKKR